MSRPEELFYRRLYFSTRLLGDRRYTASHFWVKEEPECGLWRAGLTKFAARMLGEVVDLGFDVAVGATVGLGDSIGWFEGFKARTDLYTVVSGEFLGGNAELEQNVYLIDDDRYRRGWLYAVRGTPDPDAMDFRAYAALLDETIDKLRSKQS
jgi:glycine cleavage system H protein